MNETGIIGSALKIAKNKPHEVNRSITGNGHQGSELTSLIWKTPFRIECRTFVDTLMVHHSIDEQKGI